MKKNYLLFIYLVLFCTDSFSQVTFNIFTDGGANDVKQTYDLGYIIAINGGLVKTNVNGDTVWTRDYDININGGSSVCQTPDSGYIDIGGAGIIKINSNGNPLWSKNYAGFGFQFGCRTIDSGFILAGNTDSLGAGGDDIFLIKTDSTGNPIWGKTYGGTSNDDFVSLQQTSDGGYIIAGGTGSFVNQAYIIKINASGDTLCVKFHKVVELNKLALI